MGLIVKESGPFKQAKVRQFADAIPTFVIHDWKYTRDPNIPSIYSALAISHAMLSDHTELDDMLVGASIYHNRSDSWINSLEELRESQLKKIFKILRIISSHRYESKSPEISIIISQSEGEKIERWLGRFNLRIFEKIRSLLTICNGGAAAIEITPDGKIIDLIPLDKDKDDELIVPKRLLPLAKLSKERNAVAIHLDQSPSISVFVNGECSFRFMNGRWLWVDSDLVSSEFSNHKTSKKLLQTSCDLADCGLGGIIVAVDKKNHEKELKNLINDDCLPYANDTWNNKLWVDLIKVRG